VNRALLLHFLRFNISSHSMPFESWLDALYVSNDLRHDFPDRRPVLQLNVETEASGAQSIDLPPHGVFAETNLCNARCYYSDGRFYSTKPGSFRHELVYDLGSHTILANVGGDYIDYPQSVLSNIVRPILQSFIMPFYALKTLHGALLTKGHRTLFLAGPGGMGKTTTAIQLMGAGYDLLSDDGPFFALRNEQAYALASLDYLHLTGATLALFPSLQRLVTGPKDDRDKFMLPVRGLQPGDSWQKPHAITHFIQLKRTPVQRPRLLRQSRAAAHRRLLNESMIVFRRAQFRTDAYPFRQYTQFIFDVVASVVRHADAYELEFANHHLAELPALLDCL
jgi:hypothetical protein